MGEKFALPFDDGLRDAKDGVEPLMDILDQPAGFLQLHGETICTLVAAQDPRVEVIDP